VHTLALLRHHVTLPPRRLRLQSVRGRDVGLGIVAGQIFLVAGSCGSTQGSLRFVDSVDRDHGPKVSKGDGPLLSRRSPPPARSSC
jgi:hypothetical protein